MARAVSRARWLRGELRVPGELGPALQALWLAAVSEGTSRIDHVPPAAAPTLHRLAGMGVGIAREDGTVRVEGRGLRDLEPPHGVVDLPGPEEAALPALAILSQQRFASCVRVGETVREPATRLLRLLARSGAVGCAEADGVLRLEGVADPGGADHEELDLPGPVKLGLLVAGLYADGPTVVREPPGSRHRADAVLKDRGVELQASRQGRPPVRAVQLRPGTPAALDVDVAGDLSQALPFVVAALVVRRSEVRVRRVKVRARNRALLDLVRQIGADLEIEESADGCADLRVAGAGRLKATRVAGQRARGLLHQVALLAMLATQTEGEFVIRDIESLRRGDYDFVDHLVGLLRRVEAKVGEFPEGIVIEGGRPLKGGRIDSRRHTGLVQAFTVAGLVAHGDMEIEDAECVEAAFPGFFDVFDELQASKPKETV